MTKDTDPRPPRLLLVDDDEKVRASIARALVRKGFEASEAEGGQEARSILERGRFDAVICDLHMPEVDGLDVLRFCAGLEPRPVFLMLTAHGSVGVAVDAMKHGAADFIEKPARAEELEAALRVALGKQALPPVDTPSSAARAAKGQLVGSNTWLEPFNRLLAKVATTDAIVLIEGETGTGKSAVARELWRRSRRVKGPFIDVNCAAIAESLMENELFGHVKGAYTGAVGKHGKVEMASGGTLFLDEIGELNLELQAKLLHLLQERTFTPVGASTPRQADVRFVAATNRDLEQEVQQGRFRSDLFFRLDVVKLTIPPLRQRIGDVPVLLEHFRVRMAEQHGRAPRFPPETVDALCRYDWPGNVRELENLVARLAVMLEADEPASPEHLPDRIRSAAGAVRPGESGRVAASAIGASMGRGLERPTVDLEDIAREGLSHAVKQYESDLIRRALEETADNVTQAAELLRMKRTTLVEKRKRYKDMGLL